MVAALQRLSPDAATRNRPKKDGKSHESLAAAALTNRRWPMLPLAALAAIAAIGRDLPRSSQMSRPSGREVAPADSMWKQLATQSEALPSRATCRQKRRLA